MTEPETRWVRDVPSDPIMQQQWSQQPIPWCTTHDTIATWAPDMLPFCWRYGLGWEVGICDVSFGGPDHKWWRDQ